MAYTTFDNSRFGHPIAELAGSLLDRMQRTRRRKALKTLLELDDHLLRDIGVTRDEIEATMQLPLSVDAATELRRISLERRKRGM